MKSKTTGGKKNFGQKPDKPRYQSKPYHSEKTSRAGDSEKKPNFSRSGEYVKKPVTSRYGEKDNKSATSRYGEKDNKSAYSRFGGSDKTASASRFSRSGKSPAATRQGGFSKAPQRASNPSRPSRPSRSDKFSPVKIMNEIPANIPVAPAPPEQDPESLILEGRKAVLEALNHEKPVDRVLIRKDADKPVEGTLRVIAAKAKERGLVVREVTRAKLDELSETGHHQGVIALCPAVGYVEIADILEMAKQKGEQPFVIVLDGVTDPHNLGAVIRTAEAGGAHGVIVPKRRAVGLTSTVAKTSAGAIEHMPVARVTNITQALAELKKAGLWIACADMDGQSVYEADLNGPVALVLGAEGVGVSRLVAQQSDFIVSIPMLGKIASLNVSVAVGVLIYEVVRRRSVSR